jgi:hypothetical protein
VHMFSVYVMSSHHPGTNGGSNGWVVHVYCNPYWYPILGTPGISKSHNLVLWDWKYKVGDELGADRTYRSEWNNTTCLPTAVQSL